MQHLMTTTKSRDHMARVACSDETWSEFKRLAQTDGRQQVNEYLGALVTNEVASRNRLRARAEDATARQVLAALDQVTDLRADLEGITARLEQLAAKRAAPPAPARVSDGDAATATLPPTDLAAPRPMPTWGPFARREPEPSPADIPEWDH